MGESTTMALVPMQFLRSLLRLPVN